MKKIRFIAAILLICILGLTACGKAMQDETSGTLLNERTVEEDAKLEEERAETTLSAESDLSNVDKENMSETKTEDLPGTVGNDGDSFTDPGDGTNNVVNPGNQKGEYVSYNVEYEAYAYTLEGDTELDYLGEEDTWMCNRMMYVSFVPAKNSSNHVNEVQYWMNWAVDIGNEAYGTRPYDEPTGKLENIVTYNSMGEPAFSVYNLENINVNYSFDNITVHMNDTGETIYFKRVSDKIFW